MSDKEVINFKFITKDYKFAEVDNVQTKGFLWWKKDIITKRKIRKGDTGTWFYLDDGDYCFEADELERATIAQKALEKTLREEQS